MDQVFSQNEVIITKRGSVGCITLNRPKALNALNLDMIRAITVALEQWRSDPDIKAVYMAGAGERGFCAGGDIKHFYKAGMDYRRGLIALETAMIFFQEEYELNGIIFHYPKPFIAHMHGITMGGGFGIAGNAKYKIVAQDTKFAMPEAKIGFFPDVGSMFHLKSLDNNIGLYLALTGNMITANDMLYCGLAQYTADRDSHNEILSGLQTALADSAKGEHESVISVLNNYKRLTERSECELEKNRGTIAKVFSSSSVSDIINMASEHGGIIGAGYQSMLINSPLSMKIACEYYQREDLKSFDDIIKQDLILAMNFARGRDFYEGIRAAVIDKDKFPIWEARTLEEISMDTVGSYFTP